MVICIWMSTQTLYLSEKDAIGWYEGMNTEPELSDNNNSGVSIQTLPIPDVLFKCFQLMPSYIFIGWSWWY